MACELTAWMQTLALDSPARAWEPKHLRLRLFSAAGRIARGGHRVRLRIAAAWPWAAQLTAAITRLHALARLTSTKPPPRPERTTQGPWNPAHPARHRGNQARPDTEKHQPATASVGHTKITKD